MKITLTFYVPAKPGAVSVERDGDVLTIQGDTYDFAPVPDGATVPWEAHQCKYIVGDVERIAGRIHIHLHLPSETVEYGPVELDDPANGPIVPVEAE